MVIARTQWLHGCDRLTLQPQGMKDGQRLGNDTFDELQVELVSRKGVPADTRETKTGGPRPDPTRNADPK